MRKYLRLGLLTLILCCLVSSCAETKRFGKSVGHKTRDVTRDIGHGTRDAVKSVGKAVKKAVK